MDEETGPGTSAWKCHWDSILRWFLSETSNGSLEGISSLVLATKTRAPGHRSTRNLIAMIHLMRGTSSAFTQFEIARSQ